VFEDEREALMLEEQFVVIAEMREISVVLSARTWNVVGERVALEEVEEEETNVEVIIGPPGRDELSGVPYSEESKRYAPPPAAAPPQTMGQKKNGKPRFATPLVVKPGYPLPYVLVPKT